MATFTSDPTTIEIQRKTLQMKEYAAIVDLGPTTIQTMEMSQRQDLMTKHIIQKISASILSDKIADDKYTARYSCYVYNSPWQHFKDLYAPVWFKKKYPVEKTRKYGKVTVKFTRFALYPKANVALQSNKQMYIDILGGFETIKDEVTQQ